MISCQVASFVHKIKSFLEKTLLSSTFWALPSFHQGISIQADMIWFRSVVYKRGVSYCGTKRLFTPKDSIWFKSIRQYWEFGSQLSFCTAIAIALQVKTEFNNVFILITINKGWNKTNWLQLTRLTLRILTPKRVKKYR